MIGIAVKGSQQDVVREFFELFKTPWEFFRPDRHYCAVICSGGNLPAASTKLALVYGAEKTAWDAEHRLPIKGTSAASTLSYRGMRIPLYAGCLTFQSDAASALPGLVEDGTRAEVTHEQVSGRMRTLRIGFDLFEEVRFLLTSGQPIARAGIATLDLHIEMLREIMLRAGVRLIEIPPVPVGAGFAVCLTHDVDHPVLRNHRWDHTAFGFLWRATFGSLLSWVRGGMSFKHLCSNWTAAGTLPFVYLGWAKDPWAEFDRYLAIEDGLGSTFFVIPHRDDPGQTRQGHAPDRRAASYSLADIKSQLSRIQSAGCEVGVHGIDAWMDPGKGRAETRQVLQLTGDSKTGIRMHWLYFDEQSPAALDEAGFQYDSTFGYNGTVGYRAGTTQVFKPLMAKRLLELPLHVMDTALFYPGHLHLDEKRARDLVSQLIENAARFGGVLTVNWHDRSIAPERLWGDFYLWLLEELKRRGAWFPTATQAVAWFQKRRSVVFEEPVWEEGAVRIKASADADEALPGLQLRVYGLRDPAASAASAGSSPSVIKLEFDGNLDTRIEFAERLACA